MKFYDEEIKSLDNVKKISKHFKKEECEQKIPSIFKRLYEIIHPSLSECGYIKNNVDA